MSERFSVRSGNRDQAKRKRAADIIVAAYGDDKSVIEVIDPVRKVFRVRRKRAGNTEEASAEFDDMDISAPSSYCIVDLWTESCSCPSTLIPCKHVVAIRILLRLNMIEGIETVCDEDADTGMNDDDGNVDDHVDAGNDTTNNVAQAGQHTECFTQPDGDAEPEVDDTEFMPSMMLAREKAIVEQEKVKLLEKVEFAMERCNDVGGYGRVASAIRAAQNLIDVCLGINAAAHPEPHDMGRHRNIDVQQAHVKATRLGARVPKARPDRSKVHRAAGYRGNKRPILGRAFSQLEKVSCGECTYQVVISAKEESSTCPNCNIVVHRSTA